jgi:uncharacterized membrane protein YraQ (UPF0718 family)
MNWKNEYRSLFWIAGIFLLIYFVPWDTPKLLSGIGAALHLLQWYAREHVILCLLPALFIAGAIAVFISQTAVVKYFGSTAKKWKSYLVASLSGTILAVCSCTILPLFAGIYKRGAGIGPATTFLYSGPAINILAIILTARILGLELGIARIVGAILFAVIIGLLMHLIFRKDEKTRTEAQMMIPEESTEHSMWQTVFHFLIMIAILVSATVSKPQIQEGLWPLLYQIKWLITAALAVIFSLSLIYLSKIKPWHVCLAALPVVLVYVLMPENPVLVFLVALIALSVVLSVNPGEPQGWMQETWGFTKQIVPLLAAGVLFAGFFLGSPHGQEGIIPGHWVARLVGGNSLFANLFASLVGALMYFATLTEVPILEGLIQNGMGKGPALALLLAGPALSLPNMLVIKSVIGLKKTLVFVILVVAMATITGLLYGTFF